MILEDMVIFKILICDDNDDDHGIFIILTRFPSVNTLIITSTLVIIILIIIIILTRFPSVDTLISEVPGSGWMSRSETAK